MDNSDQLFHVHISKLRTGVNPRGRIRDVSDLVISIRAAGLRQPLEVAEPDDNGNYEVMAGARRLRALRRIKADGDEVPGIDQWRLPCYWIGPTEDTAADLQVLKMASNVYAEPPLSQTAAAVREAILAGWSIVKIAQVIGRPVATAETILALADADEKIKRKVDSGDLSLSAFRDLITAPASLREEVANAEGRVTVQEVRRARRRASSENGSQTLIIDLPDSPDVLTNLTSIRANLGRLMGAVDSFSVRESHILREIAEMSARAGKMNPGEFEELREVLFNGH